MRLGTCIALELAIAAGAVGGVWFGVGQVTSHAGDYLATREASANASPVQAAAMETIPAATLPVALAVPLPPNNIFGKHDDELLAPIGIARVTRIKFNLGGTSLSIRLDFANGVRAAFKPEQSHVQSDPRREIAAYRMDRMLGIGHVPPAKEITVPVKDLLDTSEPGYRAYYSTRITDEATIRRGNVVHGVASWWIPEIKLARLGVFRIDEREGRDIWTSHLQVGARIPAELRPMIEQISKMLLFDLLVDNADRWSGSNTMMSPDGKLLYFMDNTMSFSIAKFGHEMNVLAMRRSQVFSRSLVKRIRELTRASIDELVTMPANSKLGRLLNPVEMSAILSRRDAMIRYIDQLISRFGEDAVLAFP